MEEKQEVIEEATIIKENILIKPEFDGDIDAKVISAGEIKDNIKEIKQYAIDLNNYYKNIKFTPQTMDAAKDEKAKINKFKDKVAEFRKKIVEEYNKPIEKFEKSAKEIEKILKETYDTINAQSTAYDESRKQEIREKLERYFNEYCYSKNISSEYLTFEELKINVTLGHITEKGDLTKKARSEVSDKVDIIAKEIETINTMQGANEILAEYLKSKDMASAISEVNKRHQMLEQIEKQKTVQEEQKLTDEQVIAKIDSLSAPKIIEESSQETFELLLKFAYSKSKLSELINLLDERGFKYEQC